MSKSKSARMYRDSSDSMLTVTLKTELTVMQWESLIESSFPGWCLIDTGNEIDDDPLIGFSASCMFLGPFDLDDEDIIDDDGMIKDKDDEPEDRDGFTQTGDGT